MLRNLFNFQGSVFQHRNNIIYYLLLGGLMLFLLKPGVNVPFVVRAGLMFLVLFPAFSRPEYLPFCMTCMVGISSNSFYQIVPTDPGIYLVVIIILYINYKKRSGFFLNAFAIYFIFLLFSLVHGDFPKFLSWGLVAVILADFIKEKKDINNLMLAFIVVSFILSLLFLLYRDQFTVDYTEDGETLERAYWTNANRFGAVIAAGGVMAVAYLSGIFNVARSKGFMILSIVSLFLVVPTIGLNASRGALLAFVISSLMAILFSKMKIHTKALVVIIIAGFVYWLFYYTDLFDLMMIRIENDGTETAGGRTEIWDAKLSVFLNFDFATQFVGIGRSACTRLAGYVSTHNDFLTAFIGYGYLGLFLFSSLIALPFIKAPKRSRKAVLLLTSYLLVECSVLEPVFRGYLFFLMFYIFTLKYALFEKKDYEREIAVYHAQLRNQRKECVRNKLSEPLIYSPSIDTYTSVNSNPSSLPKEDLFKEEELPVADAIPVADEHQQHQEPQLHQSEPKPQPEEEKDKPKRLPKWAAILLSVIAIGAGCYVVSSVIVQDDVEVGVVQDLAEEAGKEKSLASEKPVAKDEPEWEKYNKMDSRLSGGGYYIMGLDRIVKARAGDNAEKIAKRVYGRAEGCCYIEVYNGIKATTELEEGREIKIPKLESKQAVRKRLKQQTKE